MRTFCTATAPRSFTFVFCISALCASIFSSAAVSKPNVLLICIDDLNTQLHCYGNPFVKSPNCDRLASMGVKFDRAYANYPVCNPSRTSMLSGLYPEHTQVFGNATAPRSKLPNQVFMPELFKKNGYYTAGIGKIFHGAFMDTIQWDEWMNPKEVGDDEEGGGGGKKNKSANVEPEFFDRIVSDVVDQDKRAGGGDKREERQKLRQERRASGVTVPKGKADKGDSSDVPFGWRATDNKDEQEPDGQIASRAIQVLEQHKDGPFFLAVGFHKPHVGHVAPKKYFDLYPSDQMPLPKEPPLKEQGIPPVAYTPKWFPNLTDQQKREIISHYSACITFMDVQLGKVMETMDRLKLWDNTIVIFWGDHGWHWGEHGGMWAKMSLMEESARVPFFIIAPGKKTGAVCPRVVQTVDIFPTLTEFCGLPKPADADGRSLLPLLDNPERQWEVGAYTVANHKGGLGHSFRDEKWTYIEWANGEAQLYNAVKDPKEYHNLAKEPEYAKTVADMRTRMKGMLRH